MARLAISYVISKHAHKNVQNVASILWRNYSRKSDEYRKCYLILEIPETSDHEQIRRAYLHLVKKYHPDNPDGNLEKFKEVDYAFRVLIQKKARERWDVEDDMDDPREWDIKHTAPQHRQYLSNEGVGSGTPFQREKQYRQMRVMHAADNVLQHRIAKISAEEKSLMHKKVPLTHKMKTKYGFDRLVEDLIQESMSKGEFSNLAGSGKPLKNHSDTNPYVDFVTHKINQVLIENGFTPEWITLQKEIREDIEKLRYDIAAERRNFPAGALDPDLYTNLAYKFKSVITGINKKIDKFNLVVPILNKQMLQINMKREFEQLSYIEPPCEVPKGSNNERTVNSRNQNKNILTLLVSYFKL